MAKKSSQSNASGNDRTVYSEFGNASSDAAFARGVPDLPPNQQAIRVQVTRKGKGGKTVTEITGFQSSPETLKDLLKTLKSQCGTGGTVKDQTIAIQGDHKQTLVDLLVKLGYKAKASGG